MGEGKRVNYCPHRPYPQGIVFSAPTDEVATQWHCLDVLLMDENVYKDT